VKKILRIMMSVKYHRVLERSTCLIREDVTENDHVSRISMASRALYMPNS